MKRILCLILSLCMIFTCMVVARAATVDTSTASADYILADSIQNGQILQCWNWSFDNIRDNMELIASQGFTAIQTSPIQPSKESTKESWSTAGNSMWVYYQPIGFTIETNTRSALGTKEDFAQMCETAHEYGVKVIVDTIFNHLANENAENTVNSQIPSDIKNDADCWHSIDTNISDYSNRYDITHNCLGGLPDLNTGSSKVQSYAIDFMKECIDAGADGFRFDAAKHIETPSDSSSVASDFWPNVLGAATSYAQSSRGITPYYYGELLDSPGGSLSITAYTEYMSVTDNQTSNNIRNAIASGSASGACKPGISNGASTSKTVQWNESHDTYYEGSSSSVSDTNLKKTWALVGTRAKVCGMYLARPSSSSTKLGAADITAWADEEVKEINKFKNLFVGKSEYFAYSGNIVYNERGTSGVVLVNTSGTSATVSVTANKMASGTYTDAISGNTFTVSGGKISGKIGSSGIAVVYNAEESENPTTASTEQTDAPTTAPTVAPTIAPTEAVTQTPTQVTTSAGYYLVGSLNGKHCWDIDSSSTDRKLTLGTDGVYTLDWTFYKGDEIKVAYYDGSEITQWYNSSGANYSIGSSKAGDCTIYFMPQGNSNWSYYYFTVQPRTIVETQEPTEKPTEAPTQEPTESETEATEPETEPTQAPTEAKAIKVENITYSATANTISLSWDAADGCFKYWVYKYDDATGQWAITASATANSAVVKNLLPDTTYKFKVIGKFLSDYSVMSLDFADTHTATTAAPAAPEQVSAMVGLKETTISWDAVEGAAKYWVYKSTSPDGPFYIYCSTTQTSAVAKKLYPDMTYYFRVASLTYQNGISCISDPLDSPMVTVETPKSADITTRLQSNTSTTITAEWSALESADKYWVMYSTTTSDTTDSSAWATGGTATDATVCTIKNLTPNTVYYVTVRARYVDQLGATQTYDMVPVVVRTAYSDAPFITFTPVDDTTVTLTWGEAEDFTDITKTWVYAYDADGNQVAMSSTTTNTATLKKATDYENCYYVLKVVDSNNIYGYLTPAGGEYYHE